MVRWHISWTQSQRAGALTILSAPVYKYGSCTTYTNTHHMSTRLMLDVCVSCACCVRGCVRVIRPRVRVSRVGLPGPLLHWWGGTLVVSAVSRNKRYTFVQTSCGCHIHTQSISMNFVQQNHVISFKSFSIKCIILDNFFR